MTGAGDMRLTLRDSGGNERDVSLSGDVIRIGRARDCELPLDSGYISRYHARLERQLGVWQVVDEGSKNGVIVNGKRVSGTQPLYTGDTLRLGDYTLVFRTVEPEDFDRTVAFPAPGLAEAPAAAATPEPVPEPPPPPRGFALTADGADVLLDGEPLDPEMSAREAGAVHVLVATEGPCPAQDLGDAALGPGSWDQDMLERLVNRVEAKLRAAARRDCTIAETPEEGYTLSVAE